MNKELKIRYEQLRKKNQDFILKKRREKNILLQECLYSLGADVVVLSSTKQHQLLDRFNDYLSSDFELFERKKFFDYKKIPMDFFNHCVYIIWDEQTLPIINCTFSKIIEEFQNITAVSFDTWIVEENFEKFLLFNHDGEIYAYHK